MDTLRMNPYELLDEILTSDIERLNYKTASPGHDINHAIPYMERAFGMMINILSGLLGLRWNTQTVIFLIPVVFGLYLLLNNIVMEIVTSVFLYLSNHISDCICKSREVSLNGDKSDVFNTNTWVGQQIAEEDVSFPYRVKSIRNISNNHSTSVECSNVHMETLQDDTPPPIVIDLDKKNPNPLLEKIRREKLRQIMIKNKFYNILSRTNNIDNRSKRMVLERIREIEKNIRNIWSKNWKKTIPNK